MVFVDIHYMCRCIFIFDFFLFLIFIEVKSEICEEHEAMQIHEPFFLKKGSYVQGGSENGRAHEPESEITFRLVSPSNFSMSPFLEKRAHGFASVSRRYYRGKSVNNNSKSLTNVENVKNVKIAVYLYDVFSF